MENKSRSLADVMRVGMGRAPGGKVKGKLVDRAFNGYSCCALGAMLLGYGVPPTSILDVGDISDIGEAADEFWSDILDEHRFMSARVSFDPYGVHTRATRPIHEIIAFANDSETGEISLEVIARWVEMFELAWLDWASKGYPKAIAV